MVFFYLSDCTIQPSSCHTTINWLTDAQNSFCSDVTMQVFVADFCRIKTVINYHIKVIKQTCKQSGICQVQMHYCWDRVRKFAEIFCNIWCFEALAFTTKRNWSHDQNQSRKTENAQCTKSHSHKNTGTCSKTMNGNEAKTQIKAMLPSMNCASSYS